LPHRLQLWAHLLFGLVSLGLSFCSAVGCVAHSTLFDPLITSTALVLKEKDFRLSPPPSSAPVGASKNALQETYKAFFDVQALRLMG
jgi:hypothetical protein